MLLIRGVSQNVFLTGCPSQFPGLPDRIYSALRPILPPEIHLGSVQCAQDPLRDAWRGMAAFANKGEFRKVAITRTDYEELGGEWIKKWWGGNWNYAE